MRKGYEKNYSYLNIRMETIENFIDELDFKNGYIQELGEHEEEYVPDF